MTRPLLRPFLLVVPLALALTGCPKPEKPKVKSNAVQNAKSSGAAAVDGAVESGKTALGRTADTAGDAAEGAVESGKTALDRTSDSAEKAATGGKKAADKATKKASGALDKVFGR